MSTLAGFGPSEGCVPIILCCQVHVLEQRDIIGGACRTEYPFTKVPGLGASTGEGGSMFEDVAHLFLFNGLFTF